jgi:hypothetical protein
MVEIIAMGGFNGEPRHDIIGAAELDRYVHCLSGPVGPRYHDALLLLRIGQERKVRGAYFDPVPPAVHLLQKAARKLQGYTDYVSGRIITRQACTTKDRDHRDAFRLYSLLWLRSTSHQNKEQSRKNDDGREHHAAD